MHENTAGPDPWQPPPKVYGVGVQRCQEWITKPAGGLQAQMEAATMRMAVIAWATGYVTGAAAVLAPKVVLRDTTGTDIETWLTTHCARHPAGTVEEAAAALVRSLMR